MKVELKSDMDCQGSLYKDTGIGIALADVLRVFERDFQATNGRMTQQSSSTWSLFNPEN